MNTYKEDRAWEVLTAPLVKAALGNLLFLQGTPEQDSLEATDWWHVDHCRICVRVRRFSNSVRYWSRNIGPDLTLRNCRPKTGNRTEYEKIIHDGLGDLYFYAIALDDGSLLDKFIVVDLRDVRAHLVESGGQMPMITDPIMNRDHSSSFRPLITASLSPASIFAARNWPLTPRQLEVVRQPKELIPGCTPWVETPNAPSLFERAIA